jgi:hypothetical protein
MSTYSLKELVSARSLPGSASALYTVPSLTETIIKQILVANTTSTDLEATLYFVPSGGTPSISNAMFPGVLISANNTLSIEIKSVLPTGSSIHGFASASASLNIHISGVEVA